MLRTIARALLPACAIGVTAFIVAMYSASSQAAVLRALSLGQLEAQSDAIAEVQIVSRISRRHSRGHIVTDYTCLVSHGIKGSVRNTKLNVQALGGIVGDIGQAFPGEAHFEEGKRYLLFLRRLERGSFRVVGMSQGAFRIDGSASKAQLIPMSAGATLVGNIDPALRQGSLSALLQKLPHR